MAAWCIGFDPGTVRSQGRGGGSAADPVAGHAPSYASNSLKSGINPKVASERIGHASVAFTLAVYSHVLPGVDRDAAEQMAALMLGDLDSED